MKRLKRLVPRLILTGILVTVMLLPLFTSVPVKAASPTVGTSTSATVGVLDSQTKSFYANGLHWVMWTDGTDLVYSTSADGAAWAVPIVLKAGAATSANSSWVADGTTVHLVSSATYRMGTLNADGSITWAAAEQNLAGTINFTKADIGVDSNHLPYIVGQKAVENKPYVMRSSTANGTWTFDAAAPWSGGAIKLSDSADAYYTCMVVPLLTGNMYFIYAVDGGTVYGKSWDGAAIGGEDTISDVTNYGQGYMDATAIGNTIHFIYWKTGINYDTYTVGGAWGVDVKVNATNTAATSPCIVGDAQSNVLFVFWLGNTVANKLSYLKCINGTWDTSPTVWVDETADTTPDRASLSGFYNSTSNIIGVTYRTLAASPYDVNYAFLTRPTVTLQAETGISMTAAGVTSGTWNYTPTSIGNAATVDTWIKYGATDAAEPYVYANTSTVNQRTNTNATTRTMANNLTPGATYYYRASIDGWGWSAEDTTAFTMPVPLTWGDSDVSSVTGSTKAKLYGRIASMGVASSTYYYWTWGYAPGSLTNTTTQRTATATGIYSEVITGFTAGTTVYYRFYVQNGATTSMGAVDSFAPEAGTDLMGTVLPIVVALVICVSGMVVLFRGSPIAGMTLIIVGIIAFYVVQVMFGG